MRYFRRGRRRAVQRRSGHRTKARYMIMIMVRGEAAGLLVQTIPPGTFPGTADRKPHHITLFGPVTLGEDCSPSAIMGCIESTAGSLDRLDYRITDFITLRGKKGEALALEVAPGTGLKRFSAGLSNCLRSVPDTATWIDRNPYLRRLHITLALNLRAGEADAILEQIRAPVPLPGTYSVAAVTVMRNGTVWREYDLVRRRWLDRAGSYATREKYRTPLE